MPILIQHIDAIARKKQRDVLTVEFHDSASGYKIDYRENAARQEILAWFDLNNIHYYPCGPFADETKLEGYRGQVYIDVPYDEKNPLFQKVQAFLDNPDGTPKQKGAWLTYYPLDLCVHNALHDEPRALDNPPG